MAWNLNKSEKNEKPKKIPKQLIGIFITFFSFFSSLPFRFFWEQKTATASYDSPRRRNTYDLDAIDPKDLKRFKLKPERMPNKARAGLRRPSSYEELGLFPRSFLRVSDKFVKELFTNTRSLVIQEARFSKFLFFTTLKCLFLLCVVPILVNFLAKDYLVRPLTEYLWNTKQSEIFLNGAQQKRAFVELKYFEDKLYFESLVFSTEENSEQNQNDTPPPNISGSVMNFSNFKGSFVVAAKKTTPIPMNTENTEIHLGRLLVNTFKGIVMTISGVDRSGGPPKEKHLPSYLVKEYDKKVRELALVYNTQSIEVITTFFSDLISGITFFVLLKALKFQVSLSSSYLFELFFGMPGEKKALIILAVTDALVGYHSGGTWGVLFEALLSRYGLPESPIFVDFLVATLPVLLDVVFKYLIFRHLNAISPDTASVYHAMIE